MAKRTQPALYELIRDRNDAPAAPIAGGGRRGPPRPLAIEPVTAWCLLAGVLAAVIGAYLFGYSAGERSTRARLGQLASEEVDRLANANDPATEPVVTVPASGLPPKSGNLAGGSPDGNAETSANPVSPTGDPRIDGLNYFVLAQVPAANADRMVAFCRERDLDAHSVPDDTGGLRFVIVTPGFPAGERRSEPVLRLEAKIRSVGLQWKSAARGNRDFSDFYPRKFAAKPG